MDCVRTNAAKRPGDMNELGRRMEIMHHGLTRSTHAPMKR